MPDEISPQRGSCSMNGAFSRRRLLQLAGSGLAAGTFASLAGEARSEGERRSGPGAVCAFAKHLQWLSFDELADYLAEHDFDGIEATVRKGGQVEPENVERDLPRLVEALGRRKRRVVVMTTEINDPGEPIAARVLKTGADLGIGSYRMGYYRYDLDAPILAQLEKFRAVARRLAEFNARTGITGLYQNHAGSRNVGASVWDLHRLLEGIGPAQIGVAFDVRHATVEGGQTWPVLWRLVREQTRAVYVKDFRWEGREPRNVPLGEGQVDPALLKMVREEVAAGTPISLHMEYIDHRDRSLQQECMQAMARDRRRLREVMGV